MTRIFISHSHTDEVIAYDLVDFLIEALGLNSREILCTSDPDLGLSYSSSSITDQLKGKLKESEALIILITADSLDSTWIPFEAGSFWTTDKTIIPILGPGLNQNDLLEPLKSFLSIPIEVNDVEDKINSATNQLAEKLELQQVSTKRRNLKLQRFIDALRAWQSKRPASDLSKEEIEDLKVQKGELERIIKELEKEHLKKDEEIIRLKKELEERLQEDKVNNLGQKSSNIVTEMVGIIEQSKKKSPNIVKFLQLKSFKENLGNDIELEMIEIPGGEFMMGSPEKEGRSSEKPQHKVTVQPFYMGKYPITQQQYFMVMGANPSKFNNDDRKPVEQVSWKNAVEFCDKLSKSKGKDYRLPTEAEWEYACRAGTTSAYYFGDDMKSDLANYNKHLKKTSTVLKYPPNSFDLYDMHGNVWEWCQDDWYDSYILAPNDSKVWKSTNSTISKVIRGGSWGDPVFNCRSVTRSCAISASISAQIGFRVVCDASKNT